MLADTGQKDITYLSPRLDFKNDQVCMNFPARCDTEDNSNCSGK